MSAEGNEIKVEASEAVASTEQPRQTSSSEQPVAVPETEISDNASKMTAEDYNNMTDVLQAIYDYREEDDYDPSRLFHRNVNKRYVPDYFDVIKEPMALSTLKQKIMKKAYTSFKEFVRDCALIPHNAQIYNRPKSQAYMDALVIKRVFISEFQKLVDKGAITAEEAELPDLGEIPEADPLPDNEDEEEEEDEEDDEEDDDSDDGKKRKRKNRLKSKDDSKDGTAQKRRGRPPRVDTPMEARINIILKGIRKFKDDEGNMRVRHFERLPDKIQYPDYYVDIREPMAIDIIKRKTKRKKYHTVDQCMVDMDLMFNNAKSYNEPGSAVYLDAEFLQEKAHKIAQEEKAKPDSEYQMEDGRKPLPDGILYNSQLYRIGDWVHITNPNDVTKPIVAQIYRTWQDNDDQKWVNACWYYRPEQTVHQYEKHFFPNEVMKTGQYRDHKIEEVLEKCFVMFVTRFNRGRPAGLERDTEVYVCEARYNEEKHKLNKIKTWASCLPDEVREKDYEMTIFAHPHRIKKIPSPLLHLLPDEDKPSGDAPKPTWGAENAPPVIGAIYRGPRDENQSPPPEPTPPPSPPRAQAADVTMSGMDGTPDQLQRHPSVSGLPSGSPVPQGHSMSPRRPNIPNTAHAGLDQTIHNRKMTPSQTPYNPAAFVQDTNEATARNRLLQQQSSTMTPQTPSAQNNNTQQPPRFPYNTATNTNTPQTVQPPRPPFTHSTSNPDRRPSTATSSDLHHTQPASTHHATPITHSHQSLPPGTKGPECFVLPDSANNLIPESVRSLFPTDPNGRILFFTRPPINLGDEDKGVRAIEKGEDGWVVKERFAHSEKYLKERDAIEEKKRAWREERDAKRRKRARI